MPALDPGGRTTPPSAVPARRGPPGYCSPGRKLVPMVVAAPLFYLTVTNIVTYALTLVCLIIELFAFVNCLTQRADAFQVVGRIPKGGWLAMTGAALLVTLL